MNKTYYSAALLATILALTGCGGSGSSGTTVAADSSAHPVFAPLTQDASNLPFPTDLLFAGSQDGTLNIPGVANSDNPATPAAVAAFADPMVALNTVDGFSTTAMLTIPFNAALDGSTANLQAGIHIFKTDGNLIQAQQLPSKAPSGATELTYGVDFIASVSGSTLAILPLKPLDESTTYIVAISTDLKTRDGENIVAGPQYLYALSGKPSGLPASLAQMLQLDKQLVLATNAGLNGKLALAYNVTTQTLKQPLKAAQASIATPSITVSALPTAINANVAHAVEALDGNNDPIIQVYAGAVNGMSSYLAPQDPVHSVWNHNGNNLSLANGFTPTSQGTVNVPVVVTAPFGTQLAACGGDVTQLPITIYQHGITSNRGTLLAIAGSLAKACQVGIAIDLPEHGIFPNGTFGALTQFDALFGVSERLVKAGALGLAPQGCLDPAGAGQAADGSTRCAAGDSYINLTNLANSRDVLRQSVVDLDSLYQAVTQNGIGEIDANAQPQGVLGNAGTATNFIGMSLGSIVGETFVATLDNIGGSFNHVVFNVGGGGIAKLLDGSPSIEPTVTGGLAAKGITKPSATYESFLIAAQTLVDSADPINYTNDLSSLKAQTPILFQEVVGDVANNAQAIPDQTVPNNVYGPQLGAIWGQISGSHQTGWLANQNPLTVPSALAGTDPLVQGTAFVSIASAIKQGAVTPTTVIGNGGPLFNPTGKAFTGIGLAQAGPSGTSNTSAVVRFAAGYHGSLLDPSAAPAVTTMMQTQIAAFLGNNSIVGESACAPACTGTITNWKPLQ